MLVSVQEVLLLCVVEKGDQHEVVQRRFAPLMYSLLALQVLFLQRDQLGVLLPGFVFSSIRLGTYTPSLAGGDDALGPDHGDAVHGLGNAAHHVFGGQTLPQDQFK